MEPLFKKLSVPEGYRLLLAIIVSEVFLGRIGASRSGCLNPLGLESGKINDSQLSSYTNHDSWDPYKARLNNSIKSWCSDTNVKEREYLQIDLLSVQHVSRIATQGVQDAYLGLYKLSYYVKTFTIKYSYDGTTWFNYEASYGGVETFNGNSDASTVVYNNFRDTFVTRFLRIYPMTFYSDMCLRVELYGCSNQTDDCTTFITTPNGSINSLSYPGIYPANKYCTWLIAVPGNKTIAVMFTKFDVYQGSNPGTCSDDYIEVRDGLTDTSHPIGGKYCNRNRTMLITTRRNVARILFHSGSTNLAHKGFDIDFLSVTEGSDDVFSTTACDGDVLMLDCSRHQYAINILQAWYQIGSFPFNCGQHRNATASSCPTFDAMSKVVSKCQDYKNCVISVSESSFGQSCPRERRQLEVFYQCTSRNIKTPAPTPPSTTAPTKRSTNAPSVFPPSTTDTQVSHSFIGSTVGSDPTLTSPATTPSQTADFSDVSKVVEPTQASSTGSVVPPGGSNQTLAVDGLKMKTGAVVGVTVVVIAVIIASLLMALFIFRKQRRRKEKNYQLPGVKYETHYSKPDNSVTRCALDYGENDKEYETRNILYQSADSSIEQGNCKSQDGNAYASCPVHGGSFKVTENPLYSRVSPPFGKLTKADHGYELVKSPPEECISPSDSTLCKVKSIFNPNYEKTLPFQNHEHAVPEAERC